MDLTASAQPSAPSPTPTPRTCLHCKWARPGKDFLSKKSGKWEWAEVDPSALSSEGTPVSPSSWRCFCFSLSGKGDRLLPRLLEEPDLCDGWEQEETPTPTSGGKPSKDGGKPSKGKPSKPKSSSQEIQG